MNEEINDEISGEKSEEAKSAAAAKPAAERTPGLNKMKPVWRILRIFLVPILCIFALFTGMVIGYVYIGKQPLSEVWSIDTWKHIFDLMFVGT